MIPVALPKTLGRIWLRSSERWSDPSSSGTNHILYSPVIRTNPVTGFKGLFVNKGLSYSARENRYQGPDEFFYIQIHEADRRARTWRVRQPPRVLVQTYCRKPWYTGAYRIHTMAHQYTVILMIYFGRYDTSGTWMTLLSGTTGLYSTQPRKSFSCVHTPDKVDPIPVYQPRL